jgi:hypothetical protein
VPLLDGCREPFKIHQSVHRQPSSSAPLALTVALVGERRGERLFNSASIAAFVKQWHSEK